MKILVIEDDPDIRECVSIALKLGFPNFRMISTHLGNEGIELVEKEKPDIVLLDLELPDIGGFEVLKNIRAFSTVPVIIETVRSSESDSVKGLTLGADDYIRKPFGQFELLARIKAVLRRLPKDTANDLFCGTLSLDASHRTLTHESGSIRLTPTEALIMEALMKDDNKEQSFGELACILWGTDYPGSDDTIRSYIRRLRVKLDSISGGKFNINSKPGIGYVLEM